MSEQQQDPRPPLIVSAREVERLVPTTESAVERLDQEEVEASAAQRATFLAAVARGLGKLRDESEGVDPDVLVTSQDPFASLLQSQLAIEAADRQAFEPVDSGGAEVRFDTRDVRWAKTLYDRLFADSFPQQRPTDDGIESIPNHARVALMADWGTGLYGAPAVAKSIENDGDRLDAILHLGDIYYSGLSNEVEERFLQFWPRRSDAVSRALNANHEMYCKGEGYFQRVLPAFGQRSSYLALQNDHWTLVGLDTGYDDHDLDDQQLAWVREVFAQAGDRKIALLSHHQLFSHFESQGTDLANKLGPLLAAGRVTAWYWGHEHRCAIYAPSAAHGGMHGRCLGHGGMPYSRRKHRDLTIEEQVGDAMWKSMPVTADSPGGRVLDGPNPHIIGKEERYLPNGYMTLELERDALVETVLSADGEVLLRQEIR